ncbi:L-glyceraldehyde 3-phosphate reductase [Aquisphaera giovannonii]|uniref:L-glyceraldehyde 3-phosphate reductase n=1 Tax=Aquisphaera giovannonii TaxID=406548 RepID=A0A5B9WFB3_9BACT|nr:aldo/keto reductase [Aquisphaera giovannonii]QEH38570.1 L-glyceraldehyde 3-phosphate reductase [Aquisphaera giovannonii]
MTHDPSGSTSTDRRTFLQAGAVAAAAAATAGHAAVAQEPGQEKAEGAEKALSIPRRPLGKTGIDVTMLNAGTGRGAGIQRILRYAYSQGIRCFDTSQRYQSEGDFKQWFQQEPAVRKEIFVVTKDLPKAPAEIMPMLDQRLAAMGTDYVDLFFVHSFGDNHPLDEAIAYVKSKEFKQAADAVKKAGKARLVGISTHHRNRAQILQAAAEGGIVDAIMVQYSPWLDKDAPLNKALDACHKAGIGLISMKQLAGHFLGTGQQKNMLDEVKEKVPMLAERDLTPFQALLHAIWTDERIASSCVSMTNTDQIRLNSEAARRFTPLKAADLKSLRDADLAHGPTLCADCDGRCAHAAGTAAALGDLTRFLTYHEHHGLRSKARECYDALPAEARDWRGADLEAARAACPSKLDFARLLPEVDRRLA